MQVKLFSPTHLSEARVLFPEKVKDRKWLNALWTDEEINACKALETKSFRNSPDASYFEKRFPGFMNADTFSQSESPRLIQLIDAEQPETIRSIGCGFGRKEMYLAQKYPKIKFYCDDIAPYVDQLNVVSSQLGLKNIEFSHSNSCTFPKADLVYCGAVFYCIEAEKLTSFFTFVGEQAKHGAKLFLTEVAYLNPYVLFRSLLDRTFSSRLEKQTGWRRTLSFIRKHFPGNFELIDFDLDRHKAPASLPASLARISSKTFPLFASRLVLIVKVS